MLHERGKEVYGKKEERMVLRTMKLKKEKHAAQKRKRAARAPKIEPEFLLPDNLGNHNHELD